jgi:membrane protein
MSDRLVRRLLPYLPPQLADLVAAVMDGYQTARARQVILLAAGLSYHAFLAIFPALIAGVLLYGLFADADQILTQTTRVTANLPSAVQDLIVDQVQTLVYQPAGLGAGLVVSLVIATVSASSGISNLMTAINATYGIVQRRSYLKRRLLSFAAMLGAVVFMVVMLGLVAVLPVVAGYFDLGVPRWVVELVRWVVTAGLFAAVLTVIYRTFPEKAPPSLRWVSLGAGIATLVFLIASAGFSFYVTNFRSLTKTYGTLAGIVVMLLWLWLLSFAVLLGAQINVEVEARVRIRRQPEAQTAADATDPNEAREQSEQSGRSEMAQAAETSETTEQPETSETTEQPETSDGSDAEPTPARSDR